MNKAFLTILLMIHVLFTGAVLASNESIVGLWKAYDDKNKPTGYIRVTEQDGVYTGVIEKGLPEDNEDKLCTACKDERKNQTLLGMIMMKNVKAKGGGYEGSEILDPFSGETYRVKLKLKENGHKMEVRGFVGISLFGRTQIWERVQHGQ